jgi:DNA invertase Pin-like site-specific DNA recombinase
VHDLTGRLLFNMLAISVEFESDLIRARTRTRTRNGMKVAAKKGKLKGGKPNPSPGAERHLVALYRASDHLISELCDLNSTEDQRMRKDELRFSLVRLRLVLKLPVISTVQFWTHEEVPVE